MIFLSILIFILAMSLRFFKTQITPIFFTRIAALAFIYSGVLTFNALHIQPIGSGIGIYSGLFQVTYYSLFFESFLYAIGAIVLLSWPLFNKIATFDVVSSNGSETAAKSPILNREMSRNVAPNPHPNPNPNTTSLDSRPFGYGEPASLPLTQSLLNLNIREDFDFLNKTSNSVNGAGGSLEFISSVTTSKESREYSLIALFSSLGGSLLLSSGDLLSMYLSIELQSFGLYILATIYRESGSATSAGLKYFLLGGLSSCLIVRPLIMIRPVTLITITEFMLCKPMDLSLMETERGVQHVHKVFEINSYNLLKGEVLFAHVLIILPSQDQELALKITGTRYWEKVVEKLNATLNSSQMTSITNLKQRTKDKISDLIIRTGDLLNRVIGIKILRFMNSEMSGDGVVVVPQKRKGLQDLIINKNITRNQLHYIPLLRTNVVGYYRRPVLSRSISSKPLTTIEIYKQAYHIIKSNPGNMTPGVDKMTLDGMSIKRLTNLMDSIKD